MSGRPPRKLVDWWMEKSPEEREAFLSDPTTSSTIKQNLAAVEAYCAANSYQVFVESETPLARRQLGCHVFQTTTEAMEDDVEEGEVKPHDGQSRAATASPCAHARDTVVLADGVTLSLGARALLAPFSPLSGVGERQRGVGDDASAAVQQSRRRRAEEATAVISPAQARLTHFLTDSGVAGAETVAGVLVRVLREAATAASYRVGIPELIEKQSEARHRPLVQRQKRVLVLSSKAVAAAETALPVAPSDVPSVEAVARPVGARANDHQGFLGMCFLMQPLLSTAPRARSAEGRKRPRDTPTSVATHTPCAWTELRTEVARVPLSGGGGAVGMALVQKPSVTITEQDVLFALHHMAHETKQSCVNE